MKQTALSIEYIQNYFSGITAALISTLMRLKGGDNADVLLAAALACRGAEEGHVCIDLSRIAGRPIGAGGDQEGHPDCPPLDDWLADLAASPLVGAAGQWRPLILDRGHFLYLQRFHHDEQLVASLIGDRARSSVSPGPVTQWARKLIRYFPGAIPGEYDAQMAAAVVSLLRRLCVISGAPGTGKTTTAARIIALLIDVHADRSIRFAICAPTGKAAARLSEALREAAAGLPGNAEGSGRFPTEASTIHRMLGYRRNRFGFNADNPLPVDVVVVDEASMIDLSLMARLLEAIPQTARLIILGDHNQLSSVETGAVMGDLCRRTGPAMRAADINAAFHEMGAHGAVGAGAIPPGNGSLLDDNVVVLSRNYRFDARTGIGALTRAVNSGHVEAVHGLLQNHDSAVEWIPAPLNHQALDQLQSTVLESYRPLFQALSAEEALSALENFMVLCALTRGPWGTDRLNRWIESLGRGAGWIETRDSWYPGRPVMIRRNDYRTGLYNGDVGVAWPERNQGKRQPRIWFRTPSGSVKAFSPLQLPEHQTAFALTVHKSQGSEYRRVVLTLPERENPVLSRELLYTGLSRARERVVLVANEDVLDLAIRRRIDRASGLGAALERQTGADRG